MTYITSPSSPSVIRRSPDFASFSTMASTRMFMLSVSRALKRKLCDNTLRIRAVCSSVFSCTGGVNALTLFQSPWASAETEPRCPFCKYAPGGAGSSAASSSSSSSSSLSSASAPFAFVSSFSSFASVSSFSPCSAGFFPSFCCNSRTSSCSLMTSVFNFSASPTPAPAKYSFACGLCVASHFTMKGTGLSGRSRRTCVTKFSRIGLTFVWMYS
mmetsp:Transcript_90361/g.238349  ORF Transcript_90361/g.238349 Transcript_90361/m.238349 type:complete len:214 (+) Transcript_90361:695-1336(+)